MPNKELEEFNDDIPAIAENQVVVAAAPQSPVALMIQAKQAGFTTDEIKDMMDLQDRNDTRIAKQAYYKAMANFKRNPPKVFKDKVNKQFGSDYVSIGNMVNSVNEGMGPFGLSARWDFPESSDKSLIKCTCILSHELGHETSVTFESPIDSSGTKNALQARKSTRTYLKLETFEAVTGMASEEGNVNDDGNSAFPPPEPVKLISESQQNTIDSMIKENNLDMNIMLAWLGQVVGVDSIAAIPKNDFPRVAQMLKKAIEAKSK